MCERHYEVEDTATGERFGNHTLAEAKTRAEAMRRNWGYKKNFVVKDRRLAKPSAEGFARSLRQLDEGDDAPDVMVDTPVNEQAVDAAVAALNTAAGIDIKTIDQLTMEVEALLREAGKRAAERYQAKRKALDEAALNDFNYVGSRHHY